MDLQRIVELNGISKTYPDGKAVLRDISLRLAEGAVGLLGPNGAGKTTLLSILVLALDPTGGSRTYWGVDATSPRNHSFIRANIGYLPQSFAAVPTLTGREYLFHCGRLRRVPERLLSRRVELLLEAVGLTSAAERRSGEYSGGMQRRLGIAQALVHAPRLLVIDEPTAGLDPEERIRFRSLLADVAETQAVVLSTHICEDIDATCHRVAVIAEGAIAFDGPLDALMRRYAGTIRLVREDDLPLRMTILGKRAVGGRMMSVVYDPAGVCGVEDSAKLEDVYHAVLASASSPAEC